MRKSSKESGEFIFRKNGVFLRSVTTETKVADTLRFRAVGTRLSSGTSVAEITFRDFEGDLHKETFDLSDFSPRNRNRVIDRLTNRRFIWPRDTRLNKAMLAALVEKIPKSRFTIVGAPGWYGNCYVMPNSEYSPDKSGHRTYKIDDQTKANLAAFNLGTGSLAGWKKKVARVAKKSSCLRLAIGCAFAAPMLRPLKMDSFGMNFYGRTSTGKTSGLVAAASVPGQIEDGGLPGWADSTAAIEQLMVGHRDGLLPMDETGDGQEKMSLAQKAKLLAFAISRNRPRNLDKNYVQVSGLTTRDYRNIVLSSSELAFSDEAVTGGKPRLGGEEVRLIDVPVLDGQSQGIFDGRLKLDEGQTAVEKARLMVDKLRDDARINQGYALREFLQKFVADKSAVKTLKRYMRDFERQATSASERGSDNRIRSNFAVIYASAVLAIDYRILPWGKKETFEAIHKCLAATINARPAASAVVPTPTPTLQEAARQLMSEVQRLDILSIKKGVRTTIADGVKREKADGFKIGAQLLIKSKRWKLPSINKAVLIEGKLLTKDKSRIDVDTVSRHIGGVKKKLRYFVFEVSAVQAALSQRNL